MYSQIISLLLPDCTNVKQTTARCLLQVDWPLFIKQLCCLMIIKLHSNILCICLIYLML